MSCAVRLAKPANEDFLLSFFCCCVVTDNDRCASLAKTKTHKVDKTSRFFLRFKWQIRTGIKSIFEANHKNKTKRKKNENVHVYQQRRSLSNLIDRDGKTFKGVRIA